MVRKSFMSNQASRARSAGGAVEPGWRIERTDERVPFDTPQGWSLIIVGNGVGFLFALLVLAISVISFPLLLDRDVGAVEAAVTSFRVVRENPIPMAIWGLIVAGGLLLGSLPFLVGLAVVLPVLGHSTWHLYRKVVEPDWHLRQERPLPTRRQRHYAAQFPASLFAGEEDRREQK